MITISKKSWHYKLYSSFAKREPTSLCGYFWSVVSCLLLRLLMHPLVAVAKVLVGVRNFLVWTTPVALLSAAPIASLVQGRALWPPASLFVVPYAPPFNLL